MSSSFESDDLFPRGAVIPGDHFKGTAWLEMLDTDPVFNCPIGNVTFEPGARNSWHKHPGGQILLVTGGSGFYQERGKPARRLRRGDVVKILPNVGIGTVRPPTAPSRTLPLPPILRKVTLCGWSRSATKSMTGRPGGNPRKTLRE